MVLLVELSLHCKMSTRKETTHLFQTLLNHICNVIKLCYKEKQTLAVCNITTALRILIFNITELQTSVIKEIGEDKFRPYYFKFQYAKQSHTFEKLFLKFQIVAKDSRVSLTQLRKRKVLEFCVHFRLTINEIEEYTKLNSDVNNSYVKKMYPKLLMLRKQMLNTLHVQSSKIWAKRYLRIIKNYKSEAMFMSTLLEGCKTYLSEHPHFAFLETISS